MSLRASTENNLPNRPEVRRALARVAIINDDVGVRARREASELVFQTERGGAAKRRCFQQSLLGWRASPPFLNTKRRHYHDQYRASHNDG